MNAPRFLTQLLGLSLILTTGLWNVLASPGEDMADAAGRFLAALTTDQKAKATFPLQDDERFNWHFIPKTRNGLQVKEMTPEQRPLAFGLLNSAMSQRGLLKATTIMSLEQILHELEQGRGRFARDPELYHFSVFGTPGRNNTWAWRVEGHHLSLNFTIVKGNHDLRDSFLLRNQSGRGSDRSPERLARIGCRRGLGPTAGSVIE